MSVRTGMLELIEELRISCDVGVDEFSVGGRMLFSDEDLQKYLDRRSTVYNGQQLYPLSEVENSVTRVYTYYFPSVVGRIERLTDGTVGFKVTDSAGSVIGTANYAINYYDKSVVFSSDTQGSTRLATFRSVNFYAAAADVWRTKANIYAKDYTFKTGFDQFTRQQRFLNALEMAREYEKLVGVQQTKIVRPDLGWVP